MKKAFVAVVLILAGVAATPAAAIAQDGNDVTEQCYTDLGPVPVFGEKACRSVHQFVKGFGRTCRSALTPEDCVTVDGRLISPALVDQYEDSWVPRALALQRGLDDDRPMYKELWAHTHNSFNAEAYDPTFSGLDPNQIYSLTDQLRMGIRAIELDVHWAPSADGKPEDGGNAPIVCHGEPAKLGPPPMGPEEASVAAHIGCTTEVDLKTRLSEVREWLDANPDEVVLLYLENNLDGNETAHARAAEAIAETLGEHAQGEQTQPDLVWHPAGSGCESLPIDLARKQIRFEGKQVLLTGNCGPGGWTSWVFERGSRWDESSSPAGTNFEQCSFESEPANYAGKTWQRYFEDATWLSAMVTGSGLGSTGEITAEEAARMVRCGVNMPGFDNVQPFDPRLRELVWSWAVDEPAASTNETCAYSGAGGFRSDSCGAHRRYACAKADGTWAVSKHSGSWRKGADRCSKVGGSFSVPKNGFEHERLKQAQGSLEVWLDYRFDSTIGWTPEASSN